MCVVGAAEAAAPIRRCCRPSWRRSSGGGGRRCFVAVEPRAQRQERGFLGDEDIRVGGVAEDEDVEAVGRAGRGDRIHRPPARARRRDPDPRCRSGAAARCGCRAPAAARPASMPSASVRRVHHREQAAERARERQRDPGEQDDEQRQDDGFQHRQPADREHQIHLVGGEQRERERRAEHEGAARADPGRRGRKAAAPRDGAAQRLHGHLQPRLGGRCARAALPPLAASGRPSVEPDFRQRVLAAQQLGAQLDRLLARRRRAGSSRACRRSPGSAATRHCAPCPCRPTTDALMSAGATAFRFSPANSSTISRASSWPAPMRVADHARERQRLRDLSRPSGCDRCRRTRPWRGSDCAAASRRRCCR